MATLPQSNPALVRRSDVVEVLLVEDDDGLLDLFSLALDHEGFHVKTASSVSAAWRQLARKTPDALLLDNGLPDGAGLELCRRIRVTSTLSGLFVAILTADTAVVEKSPWLEAGADTCWPKPISTSRLAALLNGELRSRARPTQAVVALAAESRLDKARRRIVSSN